MLAFDVLYEYDASEIGITVPVELRLENKVVRVLAKLDTGATLCIFQRERGEELGLNIEDGIQEVITTPTGTFVAYGHNVSLSALGFQLDVMIYFASMAGFSRNVLGRHGWMQQLKIGIVDYEGRLYVGRYDDAE